MAPAFSGDWDRVARRRREKSHAAPLMVIVAGENRREATLAMSDKALRTQLADFVDSHHAHVAFDQAVKGLPPKLRGVVPAGWVEIN